MSLEERRGNDYEHIEGYKMISKILENLFMGVLISTVIFVIWTIDNRGIDGFKKALSPVFIFIFSACFIDVLGYAIYFKTEGASIAAIVMFMFLYLVFTGNNKPLPGHCEYKDGDGNSYYGGWGNGLANKHGTMIYADSSKYSGEWANGFKHGSGCTYYQDGSELCCGWKMGIKHGYQHLIFKDGSEEVLSFSNGVQYSGYEGKRTYENGEYILEESKILFENGNKYIGDWKDNEANGQGELICAEGESCFYNDFENHHRIVKYKGQWKNGLPHGKGTATLRYNEEIAGFFANGIYLGC